MNNLLKHFCIAITSLIIIIVTVLVLAAKPTIVLNGSNVATVQVSEDYNDAGASAYIYSLNFTDRLLTKSNVDTSREGMYSVEYSFKYRNQSYSKVRMVYVVDSR